MTIVHELDDLWRSGLRSVPSLALRPGTSPSKQALRHELQGCVQAALEALAARDREVLVLRYLEQLSTAEVAAVLGITPGAVKVRHLRALERLRGLLADDLTESEP